MARRKEYDRNEALDAATLVFWVKGYKGTAVSDLVSATGLNKHSMYQEFGSKDGLFQECINNYVLETKKDLKHILTRPPIGMKNIEEFFYNRISYAASEDCIGCFLINTAIEKELIELEAFDLANKYILDHQELFYRCLKAAQAKGEIPKGKNCRILAKYLLTFLAGLMVIGKTKQKRESLETMLEMVFTTIKG